jgi:hypothetical protein
MVRSSRQVNRVDAPNLCKWSLQMAIMIPAFCVALMGGSRNLPAKEIGLPKSAEPQTFTRPIMLS